MYSTILSSYTHSLPKAGPFLMVMTGDSGGQGLLSKYILILSSHHSDLALWLQSKVV